MTGDEDKLHRIIDCCEQINQLIRRFGDDFDIFVTDAAFRCACDMNLILIGEAARGISKGLQQLYPHVRWVGISGLRNLYLYDPEGRNNQVIWNTLRKDIPGLRHQAGYILQERFKKYKNYN